MSVQLVGSSAVLLLLASVPAAADWPAWAERWLFNPEERTSRAIESFERGEPEDAVEPLETALRLAAGEPVARYNAGTARLVATNRDALSLLEAAAEGGARELVPRTRYNLGNARMAGGDLPGAIEAYKEALRHDPALADAKFNLELAQRRLEEQQQKRQDPQQDRQQRKEQRQQEREPQEQPQEEQDPREQNPRQDPQREPQQDQGEQSPRQDRREGPLPEFRDLPDMTAEEAAAILEAIENMEREQRRQQALEAASKHVRGKKDW